MKWQLFLITLTAAGTAYPTWAAEDNTHSEQAGREIYAGIGFSPDERPLHMELGLSLGALPIYEGADDYGANASLLLSITKPGAYFINGASINPNDGLLSAGLSLVHLGYRNSDGQGVNVTLGPYLRAHSGRDEDEDDDLTGLGDIDASAGIGLFLNVDAGDWTILLAAAPHEVDELTDDGLLVSLDIRYRTFFNDSWTLDMGLASSWANDEYTQGYFGVNATQSAASGYTVYDAKAGVKDIGLYVQSSYAYASNWLWHAQIGYWELQGDAADSPIVEAGSTGQFRALTGLSYQF